MTEIVNYIPRPSVKQTEIVKDLVNKIITGRYPAGSKLPSQADIAKQYDACRVTAQRAMQYLEENEYVRIKHRVGAFVADHPPHLCRIGVAFGHSREKSRQVAFHNTLRNEFERLTKEKYRKTGFKWEFLPYYGRQGFADSKDRQPLIEAASTHRLAGLIFTWELKHLANDLAGVEGPPLRIAFGPMPGTLRIRLSNKKFLAKALDYLAERGKKRVGFVLHASGDTPYDKIKEDIRELTSDRSMTTRSYWIQGGNLEMKGWTARATEALMKCDGPRRPDALIICDDNFVPDVTAALKHGGLDIPGELEVVTHCNFPHPTPSAVPVTRLGFNISNAVETCLNSVKKYNKNREVPREEISFEPLFEEELPYPLNG